MVCKFCGNEIDDNSIYCPNCGRRTDGKKECPKCKREVGSEPYCPHCGTKIEIEKKKKVRLPKEKNQEFKIDKEKTTAICNSTYPILSLCGIIFIFFMSFLLSVNNITINTESGDVISKTVVSSDNILNFLFQFQIYGLFNIFGHISVGTSEMVFSLIIKLLIVSLLTTSIVFTIKNIYDIKKEKSKDKFLKRYFTVFSLYVITVIIIKATYFQEVRTSLRISTQITTTELSKSVIITIITSSIIFSICTALKTISNVVLQNKKYVATGILSLLTIINCIRLLWAFNGKEIAAQVDDIYIMSSIENLTKLLKTSRLPITRTYTELTSEKCIICAILLLATTVSVLLTIITSISSFLKNKRYFLPTVFSCATLGFMFLYEYSLKNYSKLFNNIMNANIQENISPVHYFFIIASIIYSIINIILSIKKKKQLKSETL